MEYQYKALTKQDEIRLMSLDPGRPEDPAVACTLTHVSLSDEPVFEALSYAWGDPADVLPITCCGSPKPVTKNLYHALRHIRHPERPILLWVDSVCIDQQNIAEKNVQVSLMGQIYSSASTVLVWLGLSPEPGEDPFAPLEDATSRIFPVAVQEEQALDSQEAMETINRINKCDWKPLGELMLRSYFRRKWVVQEITLARDVQLRCGEFCWPWDRFAKLCRQIFSCPFKNMIDVAMVGDRTGPGPMRSIHNYGLANARMIDIVRNHLRRGHDYSLAHLLVLTRFFQCSNPRDHVYALLGMVPEARRCVRPTYDVEVESLFRDLVTTGLQEGEIQSYLALASDRQPGGIVTLPSWTPDFTKLDESQPMTAVNIFPYRAASESRLSLRFSDSNSVLCIRGRIVARLEAVYVAMLDMPMHPAPPEWQLEGLNCGIATTLYNVIRWLEGCEALADLAREGSQDLGRILLRDIDLNYQRTGSEHNSLFSAYKRFLARMPHLDDFTTEENEELVPQLSKYESQLQYSSMRKLCLTTCGRLGMMPRTAETGDLISIFHGGHVPYLIRRCPDKDGKHVFIGECYMHGMMDGEAMEMDSVEDTELLIV